MKFVEKKLAWTPDYIVKNPNVLTLSLEKRLIPRYAVLHILMHKGLIKPVFTGNHFKMSNQKFMMQFVTEYQEKAPEIVEAIKVVTDKIYGMFLIAWSMIEAPAILFCSALQFVTASRVLSQVSTMLGRLPSLSPADLGMSSAPRTAPMLGMPCVRVMLVGLPSLCLLHDLGLGSLVLSIYWLLGMSCAHVTLASLPNLGLDNPVLPLSLACLARMPRLEHLPSLSPTRLGLWTTLCILSESSLLLSMPSLDTWVWTSRRHPNALLLGMARAHATLAGMLSLPPADLGLDNTPCIASPLLGMTNAHATPAGMPSLPSA
ncbi:hypothetical protein ZIOFF_013074 [Zingiber officinale]|uniref:Uncharacterized protein n=1 Tax=Zingiber officinale TaxID=94328 RepID=A0A8J5H8A3_ZINOF|nr:hypothetical protein ZIOFF_013074 [Zingiber officinale]